MLSQVDTSKVIESLIFQELHAFLIAETESESPPIFYWKNKFEVDFIIKLDNTILPIEVKYSNRIDARDLRGVIEFCKHFGVHTGIVVTKDTFEERVVSDEITIYLIPVLIFTLVL